MTSVDYLKQWWLDYEKETVFNRAVPNIMDGFKPVHRKIFYTALHRFGNSTKSMNTNAFSGAVKDYSNYHHGDLSLAVTINNLTADYKNNLSIFLSDANFGSRIRPVPAAPRYTDIAINKEYSNLLIMPEILKYTVQDDKETHEPDFYMFALPMVLINGISGIAVGVKTDILSYSIDVVRKNVERVLAGEKPRKMQPKLPKFSGKIKQVDGRWVQYGTIEKTSSTTLQITEIPSKYNREKYVSLLQKLKESGTIIDYTDYSKADFVFEIKATRNFISQGDLKFHEIFKLDATLNQNIVVLSPNGEETITYDNPEDLIEAYVKLMLGYVSEYITFKKKEYKSRIEKLRHKIRFIEYILSIDIRKFVTKQILENTIKIGIPENYAKEFMSLSILGLTKDSIDKYNKQILDHTSMLQKFKTTTPKELYLEFI